MVHIELPRLLLHMKLSNITEGIYFTSSPIVITEKNMLNLGVYRSTVFFYVTLRRQPYWNTSLVYPGPDNRGGYNKLVICKLLQVLPPPPPISERTKSKCFWLLIAKTLTRLIFQLSRSMWSQAVICKAQSTRAGRSFAAAANFALSALSVASHSLLTGLNVLIQISRLFNHTDATGVTLTFNNSYKHLIQLFLFYKNRNTSYPDNYTSFNQFSPELQVQSD